MQVVATRACSHLIPLAVSVNEIALVVTLAVGRHRCRWRHHRFHASFQAVVIIDLRRRCSCTLLFVLDSPLGECTLLCYAWHLSVACACVRHQVFVPINLNILSTVSRIAICYEVITLQGSALRSLRLVCACCKNRITVGATYFRLDFWQDVTFSFESGL